MAQTFGQYVLFYWGIELSSGALASLLVASGSFWWVILAHSVLTAPFAMAIIRLRLNQMDPDLESAAHNLGSSEWQAMRHVIVPFCKPAIVSALCLTAAVSFDEFAVSWFVSGLNKTVPVLILEIVQGNIDPRVNAIGTFVFLTSDACCPGPGFLYRPPDQELFLI